MIPFELKQIAGKAAGTYFVVTDNSTPSQNEIFTNLRVAPISSEKGNVNQLIIFKKGDTKAFESIFGKKNRRQEKRGNFSHSACIEMIKQGDLGVINLRAFNDTLDKVGVAGMNSDGTNPNKLVTAPYSGLFNPDGFWTVKDNLIVDAVGADCLINFANTGNRDLTVFTVFDNSNVADLTNEGDETLTTMEIEVEEYPGLNPNMKLKDTFVSVFVFENTFNNASANEFYGDLFKQVSIDGVQTTVLEGGLSTLNRLKNIAESGFVSETNGSLIPFLKSEFDSNLSIDVLVNSNSRTTGLTCTINSEVFETEFTDKPYVIDPFGQSVAGFTNLSTVKGTISEVNKLKHDGVTMAPGTTDETAIPTIIKNRFYKDIIDNSVVNNAAIKLDKDANYINVDAALLGLFKNENLNSIVNIDDASADRSGLGDTLPNPLVENAKIALTPNPTETITALPIYHPTAYPELEITINEDNGYCDVNVKVEGLYEQFIASVMHINGFDIASEYLTANNLSLLNIVNFIYKNRADYTFKVEIKTQDNLSRILSTANVNIFPDVVVDFLTANADNITMGITNALAIEFDSLLTTIEDVILTTVNVSPSFTAVGIDTPDEFFVDAIYSSEFYSTTVSRFNFTRSTSTDSAVKVTNNKPSTATAIGWPETPAVDYVYNSYKLTVSDVMLKTIPPTNQGQTEFGLSITKPVMLSSNNLIPTELKGIKLREAQLINGSAARQSEILDVLNSPSIVKGFKNSTGIRYFVDVFKTFVETDYKNQFNTLVHTLDGCNKFTRALVNEPFVTDLGNSTNPSFRDAVGTFSLTHLKNGGNVDNSTAFINKPRLAAEMVYYFGSGHLDATENLQIVTPAVSGLFITKSKPWSIVANSTGQLSGITTLEDNPDDTERKILENFGWNPIIKKKRDFVIYGDFTGMNSFKRRKALSFISNSELLAYIKFELHNMSLDENFTKGSYSEYIKFETSVKNFMDGLALQVAIKPNPKVVCNFSNNTEDIQNAGIKLVTIEYYNLRTLDKVVFSLDLK